MRNTYETLQVGDTYTFDRHISREDILQFARVTGDDNPVHVDPVYALTTPFQKPIAHGVLLLGIISKVLGRDFPGHGSVAVSLSCRFLRPVPEDSDIQVEVKVAEKIERHRHVRMKVMAYLGGRLAVGGDAVLIPPSAESE